MATYTVQRAKHATLVAATVDTINFTQGFGSGRHVEIINRGASGDIYVRSDGTDPVSVADENDVVRPGESVIFSDAMQFRLISAGTPPYSIIRVMA